VILTLNDSGATTVLACSLSKTYKDKKSPANAKGNARQRCMFEDPLRTNLSSSIQQLTLGTMYYICQMAPPSRVNDAALEMCVAAQNRRKVHKNLYSCVEGHPRSLISVAIESQCTTFY